MDFHTNKWLALLVISTAACGGVDPSLGSDPAETDGTDGVAATVQPLTNVAGLTLRIVPIRSIRNDFFSQYVSSCIASFTDRVHAVEARCIMQQFTPQTDSWRSISDWESDVEVSNAVAAGVEVDCDPDHVTVLRMVARGRVRAASGAWTDLEQLIGPATSVRCAP